jgi:spore maturation protein CgeB
MSAEMPLVSVLMCVYNQEQYISQAVESILSQTYSDFELIIIDDGSQDRTGQILDSYKDNRLKIIHQVNQGVPRSRNRLLKLSRGEYVAIHDGDDISGKERLEVQVKFLDEHPEISVVGSFIEFIDEKGLPVDEDVIRVVEPSEIKRTLERGVNCMMHGSVMFRRGILDVVGGYDERFRYAHDYEFWLRVSEHFKLANIPQILYKLRSHSNKISRVHAMDQHIEMRLAHKMAKERRKLIRYKDSLERRGDYKRFGSCKLRILILRQLGSKTQPQIIKDCIYALNDLGHITKVSDYTKDEKEDVLLDEIEEFHPDLLLTLNHTHFSPEIISLLTVMKIPHVSWFVEDPFLWLQKRTLSPYYVLFICDRIYLRRLKEAGFEHVFYLPLGTNPKIFKRIELSNEDLERFDCNICFVGGSNWREYSKFYKNASRLADNSYHKALVERVVVTQAQNPILDISTILETIQENSEYRLNYGSFEEKKYFETGLEYAAMAIYRSELLKKVAHLGLYVYGDVDGWRRLISDKGVRFFSGLDYYRDLPRLYNAARISLNITVSKLKTGIGLRLFDISACEGFALTDYRSDLFRFFDPEEEVVCYKDEEELRELCEYYLTHPERRGEIAKRARARVLSEHTYKHRMKELIEKVKGIFA